MTHCSYYTEYIHRAELIMADGIFKAGTLLKSISLSLAEDFD